MSTNMVKIEVATATLLQLDWLIAKCENEPIRFDGRELRYAPSQFSDERVYSPTTRPEQIDKIIEREGITLIRAEDDYEVDAEGYCTETRIPQWFAECDAYLENSTITGYEGEYMESSFLIAEDGGYYDTTPWAAAARAYVAHRCNKTEYVPSYLCK